LLTWLAREVTCERFRFPIWVSSELDDWLAAAAIERGKLFRRVDKPELFRLGEMWRFRREFTLRFPRTPFLARTGPLLVSRHGERALIVWPRRHS